jgi:D-alanyl-D-alanine carboxypeptidase/D-alanyl-D-alanine-endopeptidase (penicillin-binding protein 4)
MAHTSQFTTVAITLLAVASLPGQSYPAFENHIKSIMNRPEYRHARFGIEFYWIEDGRVLYSWNPQEFFVPGSTTKILTRERPWKYWAGFPLPYQGLSRGPHPEPELS